MGVFRCVELVGRGGVGVGIVECVIGGFGVGIVVGLVWC